MIAPVKTAQAAIKLVATKGVTFGYPLSEWRDIVGYEGRYQVSTEGEVKALSFMQRYLLRTGAEAFRRTKERLIAQQQINSGYLIVHLHLDNKRTALTVHRLVAQAFIAGSGETVNHKNGTKTDNRAANLEWATYAENHNHAVETRLNKQALRVIDPQTGIEYPSIAVARKDAGVHHRTISRDWARA